MYTLDDEITVKFTFSALTGDTIAQYKVCYSNDFSHPLFVGKIFILNSSTKKTIHLNNILNSLRPKPSELINNSFGYEGEMDFYNNGYIQSYTVILTINSTTYTSDDIFVHMANHYPNMKNDMLTEFPNPATTNGNNCILLQGVKQKNYKYIPALVPRYPFIKTNNYGFVSEFLVDEHFEGETLPVIFDSKDYYYQGDWSANYYDAGMSGSLKNLLHEIEQSKNVYLDDTGDEDDVVWDEDANFYPNDMEAFQTGGMPYLYATRAGSTSIPMSYRFPSTENPNWRRYDRTFTFIIDGDLLSELQIGFTKNDSMTMTAWVEYEILHEIPENQLIGKYVEIVVPIEVRLHNNIRECRICAGDITINLRSDAFPYTSDKENILWVGDSKAMLFDIDCYSDYYLSWQDRYGSVQSQPFKKLVKYTEDIKRSEFEDYNGIRRYNNVQVQPKWEIYTDWIPEELYPYYESIFVSNGLVLYDTKEDKSYSVMVKENYVEKKYHNQKKLINLKLELVENKIQNMSY